MSLLLMYYVVDIQERRVCDCVCWHLWCCSASREWRIAQASGEKKKKNLFGKKLSFTRGKDRIGSEDTLSG